MSTRRATDDTTTAASRIGPDDPRYREVVEKRFNKRFAASPDYIRLVSSARCVPPRLVHSSEMMSPQ
jgi:hypothetical protein